MRILLAGNALYHPAHGGGERSNRLLLEALAARGHSCRVVARIPDLGPAGEERYLAELRSRGIEAQAAAGVVSFGLNGVEVAVVTNANLRACLSEQAAAFEPEVVLASTDDPAQLLLETALRIASARVVYLVRATLAVPFGPDCAFPSAVHTERLRKVDAVVGVSQYVAEYIRRYAGIDAVHVPISLMEPGPWPELGRFENEFVTMTNPCAVKGLDIFLGLADRFPLVSFAAVPTWGTTAADRAALAARPNIRVLDPTDRIDVFLGRTNVLLVPSVWAEARSRIVVEAMLRGVPVMAANVGGIPEAKMGVPYLLPVRPIERYRANLDERMVPIPEVPPQDIGPWAAALARLLEDPAHYREVAAASRAVAIDYASKLSAEPFERLLEETVARPRRMAAPVVSSGPPAAAAPDSLSPEKRRLLAIRLRQKAPAAAWFPGAEKVDGPRLFCFPHAGGGTAAFSLWRDSELPVCPVRLPGRESRLAEAPFERMGPLVDAVVEALQCYLSRPFVFFGHSMGAAVAFEAARALRKRGHPGPAALVVAAARAPGFRRDYTPPPSPSDEQLLDELRRLEGTPEGLFQDPAALRALLPALRADSSLYRTYTYAAGEPLVCPVLAYGGMADQRISREHLEPWCAETAGLFAVRLFPGGHFFLRTSAAAVLLQLAADLKECW